MTVNTLGTHEQDRSSRTAAEWLWPLMPIGISVFFLSALVYYHLGRDAIEARSVLQVAVAGVYRIAGFAPAVLCFLLALTWSSIWFATGQLERPIGRLLRLLAMTVMLSVFLNVGDGGATWFPHKGQFGAWLAGTLLSAFGYLPSLVLVWAVTFASLLLATDFFFSDSFERLRHRPGDAGVEVAVTDHLRGLAQTSGPTRPERPQGLELAKTAPSADPLATPGELATAAGLEREPEVVVPPPANDEEPEVEPAPRRRTYAERRAMREHEFVLPPRPDVRGHDADEGVGAAADSEEFESSEASAGSDVLATPTAETGSEAGAEVESDEEWTAPAAARDEIASEDSEDDLLLAGAVEEDEEDEEDNEAVDAADEDDGADDVRVLQPGDAAREPLVQIPRLDAPPVFREPTAPGETRAAEGPPERAGRQQELFAAGIDEGLIEEAIELVTSTRRASATLLQRKLRVDYARAMDLLAELAARGLVELEDDASQGRVLGQ